MQQLFITLYFEDFLSTHRLSSESAEFNTEHQ